MRFTVVTATGALRTLQGGGAVEIQCLDGDFSNICAGFTCNACGVNVAVDGDALGPCSCGGRVFTARKLHVTAHDGPQYVIAKWSRV